MRRALWLLLLFLLPALAQTALEEEVMARANAARVEAGLAPLDFYPELYQAARAHALDMLRRGYFAHEAPGGPTLAQRLWRAGVFELRVAENLFELEGPYLPADFAEKAVAGWLKSPGHRQNLLDPEFTHTAVAVVAEGNRFVAVQEFAYRPFPLSAERRAGEEAVLEVALSGEARRPLGLVYRGYFLAQFAPGPVRYFELLPPGERPALVYDAGGYYQEARCPEDCGKLGVRFALAERVRPGYRVAATLPPGRYLLYFGEEPRYLKEVEGPFELFAPRAWRFLWLGREGAISHRIPLF